MRGVGSVERKITMPYRRKDSPDWWISYTDASGKRVRCSSGTKDYREAERLEAKCLLETHQLKHWNVQPERTYDELMVSYLKAVQDDKRRPERDIYTLRRLTPYFRGKGLTTLKRSDIRGYIDQRKSEGVKSATINREIGLFSAALNYARREWEWDIPNPAEGMRQREPEGRVRSLTVEEARRLLHLAEGNSRSPWLPDFIRLALNTGCRRDELLRLEWRRVDLKANLIHLEGKNTKSGKRRSVPLNEEARMSLLNLARFRAIHCPDSAWVFCHKDGERLQAVRRAFSTVLKQAGVTDFRIHDLRHTCASWLVSAGQPLHAVRDLLGHSTVKMTERYAHLAPENVRAAVVVLNSVSRFGHAEHEEGAASNG